MVTNTLANIKNKKSSEDAETDPLNYIKWKVSSVKSRKHTTKVKHNVLATRIQQNQEEYLLP